METLKNGDLTLGTPIKLADALDAICLKYGGTKESLMMMVESRRLDLEEEDQVVLSIVVHEDKERSGVLHIAKVQPQDTNEVYEKPKSYNLYPQGEKDTPIIWESNFGNLTVEEEREKAVKIRLGLYDDRFHELKNIARYPTTREERAKRINAVTNPSTISEYITFDVEMSFDSAFKQIRRLFSVFSEYAEIFTQLARFNPENKVKFTLVVQGDGKELPNILHLTRIAEEGKYSFGQSIYPHYVGAEHNGSEYSTTTVNGDLGNLTPEEEAKLAYDIVCGQYPYNMPFHKLKAVKQGTLTREEAEEFDLGIEPFYNTDQQDFYTWIQSQSERLQYLYDKSIHGFKTIETWREWKEQRDKIAAEDSKRYREQEIQARAHIQAEMSQGDDLDRKILDFFAKIKMIPTEYAVVIIKRKVKDGWDLVEVSPRENREQDSMRFSSTEEANGYNDEAFQRTVRMYFTKDNRYFARNFGNLPGNAPRYPIMSNWQAHELATNPATYLDGKGRFNKG